MSVLARALALVLLVLGVVGGVIFGIAARRVGRSYDVPPPPIARATDPAEIARGGRLFRTLCLGCHGDAAGDRASGGRVADAPKFLGAIWASNLTADPDAGIGRATDGQLARLLRNGIGRDDRYAAAMPRFTRLGDADVAALIGFLRSSDPLVAPVAAAVPRSSLGVGGTLALAYAAGIDTHGAARVPQPPRAPTADCGRYLAATIYGCVDCHTDGFAQADEKLRSPLLLAGGFPLRTPRGESIYATNLTPDPETGLGRWTEADFTRALATGIGPAGIAVRAPMPVFRNADDVDLGALWAFTRALPPVRHATPAGPAREHADATMPIPRLFAALGCAACHGQGAPHAADLKRAAPRAAGDLAAAIRNPERAHPGTQMPTYAAIIDEPTALRLADWIGGGMQP